MTRIFIDTHEIRQLPGKTLTQALYDHLTKVDSERLYGPDSHGQDNISWDGSFQSLSAIHAHLHGRLGRTDPENDSHETTKQKMVIEAKMEAEYAISMPAWFYRHSFLSDLKAFERTVRAAYLARPSSDISTP